MEWWPATCHVPQDSVLGQSSSKFLSMTWTQELSDTKFADNSKLGGGRMIYSL